MNNIAKFFFILLVIFCLVVFVMNKSISSYLEQRYHVYVYPKNDILNEANGLKVKLEQIKSVLFNDSFASSYEQVSELEKNIDLIEKTFTPTPINPPQIKINPINTEIEFEDDNETETNEQVETENTQEQIPTFQEQILNVKQKDEEFLLIGDSLMQGVALALKRDLKQQGINSTDLSKQNTGLSYKNYFNWATATQIALENNSRIKYLVVLLGANDPWNIKKFRFNSEEWNKLYASRVDELIQIAKAKGVRVLWYEIPPVKKEDLNAKIQILNGIYRNEIYKNNEIFIQTDANLSQDGLYSSYIKNEDGKSVKVRADDGIHFTYNGSKIMSKLLLQHLNFEF
ncbi:DUF459 domain-containing protein [Campylobacter sp. MIT 99-7217]|uniref:SGNH/GDSL hydrolase family protein n=1 Tax=Campylobacter sp. MIT 99-7217 TaxID=535091 RepID=UPI001159E0C0|nr:GDSL-type esterase/lipase family protein [Campylobacter sp. MIT 99-7217]TQR33086.1 DUF459 domain-containing protein [Campylobacter sp. MIT 99-7217]